MVLKTLRRLAGISINSLRLTDMREEITLEELKEWLSRIDEVTLLEILDISSEELVERFTDEIEDNYDKLKGILDDIE